MRVWRSVNFLQKLITANRIVSPGWIHKRKYEKKRRAGRKTRYAQNELQGIMQSRGDHPGRPYNGVTVQEIS
jgi:hypothetical protein